ncbi:MAG: phage tail tape measure protein, partial [Chloroflexi bacterium]|nr:phage tail tape measure protein [Chloroflexota bacterium]
MARTLDELFVDFGYRADTSGLDKADNRLTKTLSNVGRMARRITAIMGGALVALAGISVGVSANFEDTLNKSVAIAVGVDEKMKERLAQTAREVAKATTFSAEEAAEAYFFLFSAGMSAEQAIAALPKVAQFAQAGNFSLAQATDLLTDAQSALGLTVDDTTQNMANQSRLANVLVKANTLANATVEQFSTSLTRQFGGALKAYNKDVTEGVAVLAAYADQGVKGSEAGTRLTAVTLDLVDVARKNEKAFAKHNVEIFNSEGNLRNYADIIASFEQALDGVSSKQQTVILGELGIQKEAQATLLQLLGSSDAVRAYEAQLQNAGGTTEQIANNQLDSLKAQLSLLKSVVTDVAIRFGSKLLPPLKSLVIVVRENEDKIVPFLAVLGLLGAAVFGLAGAFTFLSMASMILSGALAFLQIISAPLVVKFLLIVGAVLLVIAVLVALGVGIFLLVKNWDQVVEWLRETWTRFSTWFG